MKEKIQMPKLLSEGCVLQRGSNTRLWGWCRGGASVEAEFQGKKSETKADQEGFFEITTEALESGGPFPLVIRNDAGAEHRVEEVYVGDVFVCAGQSNMELPVSRVREKFPDEAGCSQVHHYKVEECPEFTEALKDHREAGWSVCEGEALEDASAFGYFFGKMMYEKEQVPVGIINISKGGTPAEAWTSPGGLKAYPDFLAEKRKFESRKYREELLADQEYRENAWHQMLAAEEKRTEGKSWRALKVPGYFADQGLENFSGLLHIKRSFFVPEALAKEPAVLKLGTITDSDRTYLNGKPAGETGYCFPPRIYRIPAGMLHAGENEILIRLECRDGKGRFTPGKSYELVFASGRKIELSGEWKCQVRAVSGNAPVLEFITRKPTGMYQGMTAPCLNAVVKGVVWYQGESNDRAPMLYEPLLKGMICDWRRHWRQERLPFVVVQLPACAVDIQEGAWPLIREAQRRAGELDDVAVTVNLDLGEANDLHPLDKKGAAYRAYLAARSLMYGEDVIWKGPEPENCRKEKDTVVIHFDTKDRKTLRTADGEEPGEFEAAGEDGVFYPVSAAIKGADVILFTGEQVKPGEKICAVRYAWSDAPVRGLLCSQEGLLTSPFAIQTDADITEVDV